METGRETRWRRAAVGAEFRFAKKSRENLCKK